GGSYDELRQYYDGLRGEKKPIPVFVILYGDADVKELSELAEYTGRRFFDALDGGLNEIFKGIRAHQNHPARDRHTQGHSPLAHMPRTLRSEEHTSELQSRFDLVCRLLLAHKNQQC